MPVPVCLVTIWSFRLQSPSAGDLTQPVAHHCLSCSLLRSEPTSSLFPEGASRLSTACASETSGNSLKAAYRGACSKAKRIAQAAVADSEPTKTQSGSQSEEELDKFMPPPSSARLDSLSALLLRLPKPQCQPLPTFIYPPPDQPHFSRYQCSHIGGLDSSLVHPSCTILIMTNSSTSIPDPPDHSDTPEKDL